MSLISNINKNYLIKVFLTFAIPVLFLFTSLEVNQKIFFVITIWGGLTIAFDVMDKLVPSIAMPTLYIFLNWHQHQ